MINLYKVVLKPLTHSNYLSLTRKASQNPANSSIEYATFNIKPSQYKQTGVFLPINNNSHSTYANHNAVRLLKDELELLVQQLRNAQRAPPIVGDAQPQPQPLRRALDQFVEKAAAAAAASAEWEPLRLAQLHAQLRGHAAQLAGGGGEIGAQLAAALSSTCNEYMQLLDKLDKVNAASFGLAK